MQARWFPAFEGGKTHTTVVGRFVDVEVVDVKASEQQRKNIYIKKPALESKVAGSNDISVQAVKDFNKKELQARFPGAWDHYLENRVDDIVVEEVPVIKARVGTPLDRADFIPRSKIAWLNEMGFSSIEQIRDMSDGTVQNLGRGALTWRKKAAEFLVRT